MGSKLRDLEIPQSGRNSPKSNFSEKWEKHEHRWPSSKRTAVAVCYSNYPEYLPHILLPMILQKSPQFLWLFLILSVYASPHLKTFQNETAWQKRHHGFPLVGPRVPASVSCWIGDAGAHRPEEDSVSHCPLVSQSLNQ